MAFRRAPKAFQSLENTHRKRSVSLFFKSLEFYASSIELSEDGKMGRIYRQPKANMGKMRKKEEKTRSKSRCNIRAFIQAMLAGMDNTTIKTMTESKSR